MKSSRRSRGARIAALAIALPLAATPAQAPQPVHSLGWPPRWEAYASGVGLVRRAEALAPALVVGVHRPMMNPVSGILGLSAEGYGTLRGASSGGGVRAMAGMPALGIRVGADWNVRTRDVDAIATLETAVRRGGLLGGGTMLRVDWLPTRGQTVGVGITVPVMRPAAGRTRARRTTVRLPASVAVPRAGAAPAAATAALDGVGEAASRLGAYTMLYSDRSVQRVLAGGGFDATQRAYLTGLDRAFAAAAASDSLGAAVARRARAGALREVLLPFAALFGQSIEGRGIEGLTTRARASFGRWLRDSSAVPASAHPALLATHARWMEILEAVHRERVADAPDARAAWLPLQLALAPEQYDEQSELDSLLALAVGRPFSDGNALAYLKSSDLPLEIARSIYAARDYHVLWMHDFTGRRETGSVDDIGFAMVADAYFPALTAAVQRYDSTGRLPTHLILLDQYFSASRDARMWMDILQDPLHADVALKGDDGTRAARLRERQAALRRAVSSSARLQRDAAANGGERWIRDVVKVHVTVTNPSDFSFRSHRTVPPIPFTPDNIIRDHRKIVFYDLNEADPFRGAILLMGVGVGEHYASATWEDRGYRLRGPAALEVRDAARRVLKRHGFRDDQIPLALRPVADTANGEHRADGGDYVGRALQVHNEVGSGRKDASVARALLYTLAPSGSVVIAPDPLWLSAEWAGMIAGAAARGARAHIVAPALENAPSPQAPLMALAHDNLTRLLELRARLDAHLRAAGGDLRVGFFAARARVDDAAGRQREVRDGLARAPWIRELIPFDARALAVLN